MTAVKELRQFFPNLAFVYASFFSMTLTVRGVSNKHCLLTFFIFDRSNSFSYFV